MVLTRKISTFSDLKELKNKLIFIYNSFRTLNIPVSMKQENALFVLILMIKKGHRRKPGISLILHNKLTKLDMEDKL